jgi:cystathionine beta-lyase/cystathionine gamma-synthase
VRTLITHPASTTASTMPAEDRARVGITDSLLRVAVGIEDEADLRADLTQALARAVPPLASAPPSSETSP